MALVEVWMYRVTADQRLLIFVIKVTPFYSINKNKVCKPLSLPILKFCKFWQFFTFKKIHIVLNFAHKVKLSCYLCIALLEINQIHMTCKCAMLQSCAWWDLIPWPFRTHNVTEMGRPQQSACAFQMAYVYLVFASFQFVRSLCSMNLC